MPVRQCKRSSPACAGLNDVRGSARRVIPVSELKRRCLEIVRRVERTGEPVAIARRGRVVAELRGARSVESAAPKPWERMRAAGGRLLAAAGESAAKPEDFEALR